MGTQGGRATASSRLEIDHSPAAGLSEGQRPQGELKRVSAPQYTHTHTHTQGPLLLDSPPLAPAAARWLPRAAPRAGGAGAQRRRGPAVPGARLCWAAGLLRPTRPAKERARASLAGQPHLGKAFIYLRLASF